MPHLLTEDNRGVGGGGETMGAVINFGEDKQKIIPPENSAKGVVKMRS